MDDIVARLQALLAELCPGVADYDKVSDTHHRTRTRTTAHAHAHTLMVLTVGLRLMEGGSASGERSQRRGRRRSDGGHPVRHRPQQRAPV
jgi:hypothetical protein